MSEQDVLEAFELTSTVVSKWDSEFKVYQALEKVAVMHSGTPLGAGLKGLLDTARRGVIERATS